MKLAIYFLLASTCAACSTVTTSGPFVRDVKPGPPMQIERCDAELTAQSLWVVFEVYAHSFIQTKNCKWETVK